LNLIQKFLSARRRKRCMDAYLQAHGTASMALKAGMSHEMLEGFVALQKAAHEAQGSPEGPEAFRLYGLSEALRRTP